MVYRLWHEKWPKGVPKLHETIQNCALKIAVEESDKIIQEESLKIRVHALTITRIRELLDPGKIAATFQRLAPFTWKYLYTFAATPNRYRREKKKRTEQENSNVPDESEPPPLTSPIDDDFDDWHDEETEIEFGKTSGFMRNPVYVSS